MNRTEASAAGALLLSATLAGTWTARVARAKTESARALAQLRVQLGALEERAALEPWLLGELRAIRSNADAYAALGAPRPAETADMELLMEDVQLELERAQFELNLRCQGGCDGSGTVAPHPALHSRWLTLCSLTATYEQVIAFFLGIERRPDRWIDAFSLTCEPLRGAPIQDDGSPAVGLSVCVRVATLRSGRAPVRPVPPWRNRLRTPDPGADARCGPRGR